jgi:uncharacterized protein YggE
MVMFSKIISVVIVYSVILFGASALPVHAQTYSSFENILSGSYPSTITVTGQSSKWVEPDQVTVLLNIQSQWNNSTSIISSQQQTVKQIIDQLKNNLPQSTVSVGQVAINPLYSSGFTGSSTYQAFSLVHVTANMKSFEEISSKFTQAKIPIQDSTITQVSSSQTKSENVTQVSINAGSGNSQNCVSGNNCFSPQKTTISTGTKVVWTNNDKVGHTITSGTPSAALTGTTFDSGLMRPLSTFSYTFLNPGNFEYYCQVHPWMTGVVVVTGESLVSQDDKARYQASINIPINTLPDTLDNTVKNYHTQLDTIKEILKSSGVSEKDISTDPLRINPSYAGSQTVTGYSSSTGITINTSVGDLSKVIDIANNAGAATGGITMTVSQKKLDSVRHELASQALDDTLEQATRIATGAGLSVKKVKEIQISPLLTQDNPVRYGGPFNVLEVAPYYSSGKMSVTATVQFELGK